MSAPGHPEARTGEVNSDPGDTAGAELHRWSALGVCLAVTALTVMNITIINIALPSIQGALSASQSQLQWVVTAYTLAFAVCLVPAGRLGDARGRRSLFLVGLSLFAAASLACGLVNDAWVLIAVRVVQGVGSGILLPQVTGFVQTTFNGGERARAFGWFGLVNGLSVAVGPLLGGAILDVAPDDLAWRAVFWLNVPIAVVALVLAARLLPRRGGSGAQHLDPVGALLLAGGVTLVLVALQEVSAIGWGPTAAVAVTAVLLLGAFVGWELHVQRRGREPLAPLGLFRRRSFAVGASVGLLFFASQTSIFFVLSLYLQSGLGYTPLEAGLAQTAFAVASAASSPLSSRYVDRFGRLLVVVGLAVFALGILATIVAIEAVAPAVSAPVGLLIALPLTVAGIGGGMVLSPNINLTLAGVNGSQAGSASGVMATGQRVGSSAGTAAVGAVFYALYAKDGPVDAVAWGLSAAVVLIALAFVPALVDQRATAREQRSARAEAASHQGEPTDREHHHRAASVP